jgi:hypothetical protein
MGEYENRCTFLATLCVMYWTSEERLKSTCERHYKWRTHRLRDLIPYGVITGAAGGT